VLGSGETGVLTFRKDDVTKDVHLHMGRIIYARSSNPDERLGEDLLLRGKISVRQYLDASRLIAPGRRLGHDPDRARRARARGPAGRRSSTT
jgi:hypothetical protein